jgi:hypothetical protein
MTIGYFARKRQALIPDRQNEICELFDTALEQFDYWEDDTKKAVCALAQHTECQSFASIDITRYCE